MRVRSALLLIVLESSRIDKFLDYKSEHPLPWYALTQIPQATFWKPTTRTHNILAVEDVVSRLWTTGPITRIAIYTGIADTSTRTQLTIQLMRQQDRDALQRLHASARHSTSAVVHEINTEKVNIVVPDEDFSVSVLSIARSRDILTQCLQVLEHIYDATVLFQEKGLMTTLYPSRLRVGDVVLVESFAVRTEKGSGWSVSFHAYSVSLLARRPVPVVAEQCAIPSIPDVVFKFSI